MKIKHISQFIFPDESNFQKSTRHVAYGFDSDVGASPAPPSVVTFGLLGDECLSDADCGGVADGAAVCDFGRCRCARGDARPSPNGDRCLPGVSAKDDAPVLPPGPGPCASHPCYGGGTCEEHDGTFTCFCPSDRTGDRCERRLSKADFEVSRFPRFFFLSFTLTNVY